MKLAIGMMPGTIGTSSPRAAHASTKLQYASALKPAFCSVTFGAGGSTREGTLATVLEIRAEGMEGAPHLSCIGGTR
ncbi:MAG TPA: methylenetetrahydrofolate reductase, partial [Steroidobacteraceae bacterium]|nr:methylenetetrahydrofolate reductase [Steroidobacteraceae bacterium]